MNRAILIAFTLAAFGMSACSGGEKSAGAQVEADISVGSTAERLSDTSPMRTYLGQELQVTTQVMTSGGNRLNIVVAKNTVINAGTYNVGIGTDVQAGFTVPGSSGVVFFETGTFNLTAVQWTSGGHLTGTFADLHRPADSLGLAPEASADGSVNIAVP